MSDRPPYLVERNPGYFEYQLPISVKLVVDHHGRVPLLKNERDEWELPGGKLEVGESPEQGACREVAEELTYTDEHGKLGVFGYDEVPDLHMPAPYKATIARWRDLVRSSTLDVSP
ncbi:NUDIX domain-containing protein [Micromonospora sp. Llam0]|uniref:NUDIX domain-containing protein n=1 Tax=Micromonospora sp. Llam0 TaxID=2485143 RepID=UPI001F2BFF4A